MGENGQGSRGMKKKKSKIKGQKSKIESWSGGLERRKGW
jgi:hypothetical protein